MNAIEIPPKSIAQLNALGTTAELITEPVALADALTCLLDELRAIDEACSRFRPDSEVMRLRSAGGRWTAASPLFREALHAGVRAAAATGGDVDPTVGGSLNALGWDRDFAIVVSRNAAIEIEAVPAAGWRRIEIDDERGRVRVPPDTTIDLGATAKALAADRAAQAAYRATGVGVLVNLGGDIAVAGPAPDGGWPVLVADDHRTPLDGEGETVAIRSGGLATSSTSVRRWNTAGGEVHHIVDPRSGAPAARVWRTVSVCAASCVDANTASTAAIVRGTAAPMWLQSLHLPARLVRTDGSVVLTDGWPGAEEQPWAA
ncbi:MAG: thiamine biosynthesis protein [Actinomycetia bacterium]|nr:thiamine biosynthesis protein [Actinomycetes bacterium]